MREEMCMSLCKPPPAERARFAARAPPLSLPRLQGARYKLPEPPPAPAAHGPQFTSSSNNSIIGWGIGASRPARASSLNNRRAAGAKCRRFAAASCASPGRARRAWAPKLPRAEAEAKPARAQRGGPMPRMRRAATLPSPMVRRWK